MCGRSVPPEPPPDTRDVHSRHPKHQTPPPMLQTRLHSQLSPTHECDHTHRRLAALTRTATGEARCESQAEEHPPCRGAQMRERAGTESLGESCDTGEWSVGAKMPWRMGGRSVRPDCLRGVDVPGMKVQGAPARHRPLRPSVWFRLVDRNSPEPGTGSLRKDCSNTVPAQHQEVRPGPKSSSVFVN